MIAYKGPAWEEELAAAQRALEKLGGRYVRTLPAPVPSAASTSACTFLMRSRSVSDMFWYFFWLYSTADMISKEYLPSEEYLSTQVGA